MTLLGCGIQQNMMMNFGPNIRHIMDVSLTHVNDCNYRFKASSIRDAEQRQRNKYADFSQRQGYAFAPMICNTLGECGPDMMHFSRQYRSSHNTCIWMFVRTDVFSQLYG